MGNRSEGTEQVREERYAIAARAVSDGLWDWDLKTDEVYYSPRWKSMLGWSDEEIGSSPDEWLKRVHSKDLGRLLGKLSDHLHRGISHFESEYRIKHRDGSYRWMRSRGIGVRDESGEAVRLVGWQMDITDRKRVEERLKHEAWHDSLTDLPNRAYFKGQLQRAASQPQGGLNRIFAVLFLDLDDFKEVNDSFGHAVGDQLLIALAERLKRSVRPGDTVARLSGDEFAILLRNLSQEIEASQIAERILRDLTQPFKIGGQELRVGVSIGIALSTSSPDRPADLLRNADSAMYRAKASGRERWQVYAVENNGAVGQGDYQELMLRRAVEKEELQLYYQPILSLSSSRVVACEALLRWQHPDKGLLIPSEFLKVAEDTALIHQIGRWMLRKASEQAKAWRASGLPPVRISVNVSNREFLHGDLLEQVSKAIHKGDLDPTLLQLELAESALMQATGPTLRPLADLGARGVEITLDDFGMAYSSLIYLRRLPIRSLKIDGFYVREIATDSGDATMAAGLIALAHSLGLKVIAEKVETLEQLDFLREEECDELQGDVFSPPLNAEDCARFLREAAENPKLVQLEARAG